MAVLKVPNAIVPSFILTDNSDYREIDVAEFANPKTGQFSCLVMIQDGTYIYRGYKGMFYSFCKPQKDINIDGLSVSGISNDVAGYVFHDETKIRMPFEEVRRAQKFFIDIYNKYKTESATIWYFNPETRDWKCQYPIQLDMSHSGIKYIVTSQGNSDVIKRAREIAEEKPEYREALDNVEKERNDLLNSGYIQFGTIHSHCDFSAFHSGVDDADEYGFDGIHITIGHVDTTPTYSQRIMGNQCAIDLDNISDVVDMEGKTIEQLQDTSDLPNMLDIYGNRCFISEKKAVVINPFGFDEDTDDAAVSKKWWEDRDRTWNKPISNIGIYNRFKGDYNKGDKIKFTLHGLECVGIIKGMYHPREKDIPNGMRKSYIGKMYWVKSKSFPIPVLVEHYDIEEYE